MKNPSMTFRVLRIVQDRPKESFLDETLKMNRWQNKTDEQQKYKEAFKTYGFYNMWLAT